MFRIQDRRCDYLNYSIFFLYSYVIRVPLKSSFCNFASPSKVFFSIFLMLLRRRLSSLSLLPRLAKAPSLSTASPALSTCSFFILIWKCFIRNWMLNELYLHPWTYQRGECWRAHPRYAICRSKCRSERGEPWLSKGASDQSIWMTLNLVQYIILMWFIYLIIKRLIDDLQLSLMNTQWQFRRVSNRIRKGSICRQPEYK